MTCTLSCDHRVVDGAVGADLLNAFRAPDRRPGAHAGVGSAGSTACALRPIGRLCVAFAPRQTPNPQNRHGARLWAVHRMAALLVGRYDAAPRSGPNCRGSFESRTSHGDFQTWRHSHAQPRSRSPRLLAWLLAGCASDVAACSAQRPQRHPFPERPKVDPACVTLTSQIDTLRKEGIADRVEKAAAKKYKMTPAGSDQGCAAQPGQRRVQGQVLGHHGDDSLGRAGRPGGEAGRPRQRPRARRLSRRSVPPSRRAASSARNWFGSELRPIGHTPATLHRCELNCAESYGLPQKADAPAMGTA